MRLNAQTYKPLQVERPTSEAPSGRTAPLALRRSTTPAPPARQPQASNCSHGAMVFQLTSLAQIQPEVRCISPISDSGRAAPLALRRSTVPAAPACRLQVGIAFRRKALSHMHRCMQSFNKDNLGRSHGCLLSLGQRRIKRSTDSVAGILQERRPPQQLLTDAEPDPQLQTSSGDMRDEERHVSHLQVHAPARLQLNVPAGNH